jgi:rhamnosyltransferase
MRRERQKKMSVDVIIPTYHPGNKFRELVRRLGRQTVPYHRLIIINTEEAGFDAALLEGAANVTVRHISRAEFDHGATRNLGVSLSNAEYFLMMTDDAIPADMHLIERMLKALETDAGIAAVYARQLASRESSFDEQYARRFNYPEKSRVKSLEDLPELGIKTYFMSDVCCMYRRAVFRELGGFIRHTIFNEDMIYCAGAMRAGYKVMYCAEAQVIHAHHYSGIQQLHRNFDLGVSQADHPEVFKGIASEGEGVRLVKGNAVWLFRSGKIWLLPSLVWRSGCKFIGYQLGKHYRSLPRPLVRKLSMNVNYWQNA